MSAKEILNDYGATRIKRIKFPCFLGESKMEIDSLELSTRSYSALRRAKINTIGELVSKAKDIKNLKGVGEKSQNEILEKLFIFQYRAIPQNKRADFINQVINMSSAGEEENYAS